MYASSKSEFLNLAKTDAKNLAAWAAALLVDGERVIALYHANRDQVVFTDRRVMTVDSKGLTGREQDVTSFPYRSVQQFGAETVGAAELIPDTELVLHLYGDVRLRFVLKSTEDVLSIGRAIGARIL